MEPSFVVDLLDKVAKVFGDHFEGFEQQSDICPRDRLKNLGSIRLRSVFPFSRGVDTAHVLIGSFFRCGPGRD